MKIEQIKVTPKQAAKWLESNMEQNRRLRPQHVATLARDMKAGNWKQTGETVKFNTMRLLIDGQHRLSAIVESGCTVELSVAWDVPSDSIMAIDTGKSRNPADVLAIAGLTKYPKQVAALCMMIEAHQSGTESKRLRKRRGMSAQEVAAYMAEHDNLEQHAKEGIQLYDACVNPAALTPSEWIFLHWLFSQVDPVAATNFLTQLSKLTCPAESPIRSLFARLTGQVKLDRALKIAYAKRTWNAWRKGDRDVSLRVKEVEGEKLQLV